MSSVACLCSNAQVLTICNVACLCFVVRAQAFIICIVSCACVVNHAQVFRMYLVWRVFVFSLRALLCFWTARGFCLGGRDAANYVGASADW